MFQDLKTLLFGEDIKEGFGRASRFLVKSSLFLAPLAFLPFGNSLGLGKQTVVGGLIILAFIFWVLKALFEAEFSFKRSAVLKVVVFVLLAAALNFAFASSSFETFFGNSGNSLNFLNIILFGMLFWLLLAQNKHGTEKIRGKYAEQERGTNAEKGRGTSQKGSAMFSDSSSAKFSGLKWFLWGGGIAVLFGTLQLFGVHVLPWQFAENVGFNTIGSINSLAIFSGFLVAMSLGLITKEKQKENKKVSFWLWGVLGVSLFYVLLIAYTPVWYGLALASFVYFVQSVVFKAADQKAKEDKKSASLVLDKKQVSGAVLVPVFGVLLLSIVALSFSFVSGGGFLNLSGTFGLQRNIEVGPSQSASFDLARKVYGEGWGSRLFGSGFGAFYKKWALHKSDVMNQSRYWQVKFQQGASGFTTMLVEGGLLVSFAFLLLFLRMFWASIQNSNWMVLGGVSFLVVAWFLYPFNFVLWTAVFILAAGLTK